MVYVYIECTVHSQLTQQLQPIRACCPCPTPIPNSHAQLACSIYMLRSNIYI